jgi:hypothetical protein
MTLWRNYQRNKRSGGTLNIVFVDRSKDVKNIVIILLIYVGDFKDFGVSELFKTKLILM